MCRDRTVWAGESYVGSVVVSAATLLSYLARLSFVPPMPFKTSAAGSLRVAWCLDSNRVVLSLRKSAESVDAVSCYPQIAQIYTDSACQGSAASIWSPVVSEIAGLRE